MTTSETAEPHAELTKLSEAAQTAKLSLEQEKQAVSAAKACLSAGKAGIIAAIAPLISLPWIVGVTAIAESWPELKLTARKQLLAALSEETSDQAKRFRLSLSRGLFTIDAPTSIKLAVQVCEEMSGDETSVFSPKDRQIFSNVFIGKGKPWLLHLPLAEMKSAETAPIVCCAIAVCFFGQCPPLTQHSVLVWIAAANPLTDLSAESIDAVANAVKRWQPKLQQQLKEQVAALPPAIADALTARQIQEPPPKRQEPPPRREKPPGPAPKLANFDLGSALRQIEAHVQTLRSELQQAKADSHRRDASAPRGRFRRDESIAAPGGDADLEELKNHNRQLTETVAELRAQLEDLTTHHEDVALSIGAHTDSPAGDPVEQFKVLLGIKLQRHYAEFEMLGKEPPDEVFREHYRLLIEDVFNILASQGVTLKQS